VLVIDSRRSPSSAPGTATGPQARALLTGWLAAFSVLFVAIAAWSFASPLGSSPDEPAHVIRAASLVRGQLLGKPMTGAPAALRGTVIVEVPQVFTSLANDIGCFQFQNAVPASCQHPLNPSTADFATETYVGRYSPFYYALVGVPTLVSPSGGGVYGARLVSGALSAAMLALALTSLRRCRGLPLLAAGLALAVTPMVLYLAATVNPNGLEVAAAVSAWTAAMALTSQPPASVSAATVGALGASCVVLMLTRALSPLWAVLVVAALAGAGPATSVRRLLRRHCVRRWLAACVLAGLAAVAWDLFADPFLTEPGTAIAPGTTKAHMVVLAVQRLDVLVSSSIGQFGWLDTPSPYGVTFAWVAALGAVVLVGICLARRRGATVVVASMVGWVVLAVALISADAPHSGILGQGRDFLGLAVGIPLVATAMTGDRFGDRGATRRFATIVISLLAICQVVDFYAALRRYTVGISGPLNAFASTGDAWHPPVPAAVLFGVFIVAMVAFAVLLCREAAAQLTPITPTSGPVPAPTAPSPALP
jgi:hypothetical protein